MKPTAASEKFSKTLQITVQTEVKVFVVFIRGPKRTLVQFSLFYSNWASCVYVLYMDSRTNVHGNRHSKQSSASFNFMKIIWILHS